MKKAKSLFAIMLAALSLVSSTSAFAATTSSMQMMSAEAKENFALVPMELQQSILADPKLQEAATYAYMDVETAPDYLVDTILDAREDIIYSQSWSVTGQSYVVKVDGTIEYLPLFSDLFPSWDVPTVNDSVSADEGQEKWVRDYLIPVAVDWTNAVPMTVVTASWDNSVCVRPMELEPASVNIGISSNGVSLSHKMNMQY